MKAAIQTQLMADLPKSRVTPSRPFQITGVDYTGPVTIKCHGGRHRIQMKAYIALFICYSTKAVHLEVVANLSSLAFFNALTRFVSRRGKPSEIHSDNGTTFVGARSLLDVQLRKFLKENQNKIINQANKEGIAWHFIPAYSPHWGGLWESNIKSMKYHLKRATSASNGLNYEQFQTLLTQIEAILNSRPLTPESSSPDDLTALTPGHFLIGGPLTVLPDSRLNIKNDTYTKKWIQIQNLSKFFWKRWSTDYINTLNQRNKWKHAKDDLKVGDFVIIKEKDLPPTNWCMGRIVDLIRNSDQRVRLVKVRTKDNILECTLPNIVYLPIV